MAGPLRRVGPAVEPAWSARLRPAWPPANPPTRTDLSHGQPRAPKATVTLGWVRTSPTVQIDAAEHRTGSADHVRRWNHPGTLAAGPRGRPMTRPPTTLGAILHGHAQVPDLTFDCNIRARRRRRRRLSGGATQTGRSGSRTGLICPSPARMAARQPSDPDGTLPTGAQRDRYTWVG